MFSGKKLRFLSRRSTKAETEPVASFAEETAQPVFAEAATQTQSVSFETTDLAAFATKASLSSAAAVAEAFVAGETV